MANSKRNYYLVFFPLIAAAAYQLSSRKKSAEATTPKSIVLVCNPPSIKVTDEIKANQLFIDVAKDYISTLKNVEDISYITLVGNVLKKLSSSCYSLYLKQDFKNKDLVLIIAYLSISVQNAFKMAYFGDIITLDDVDVTPEIAEDFGKWKQFRDVTNPEKIEEFQKYIGYTAEMSNELNNVTQIILQNDMYPV